MQQSELVTFGEFTFTKERSDLLNRYNKLKLYSFSEEYPASEVYAKKADELKLKNNVSDEEIRIFNLYQKKKDADLKEELSRDVFFLNNVKFKSTKHLMEYLNEKSFFYTIYFLIRGMFNPFKPIKKNK